MIIHKATIIMLGRLFGEKCFPEIEGEVGHYSEKISFEIVERGLRETAVQVFISVPSVSYTLFQNFLKTQQRRKWCVSSCKLYDCLLSNSYFDINQCS